MFGNQASTTQDEPAGDGVVDMDAGCLRLAYRLYRLNRMDNGSPDCLKVWRTTLL